MSTFTEKCVLRFVLDAPPFVGSSVSFDTLSGSTYTVEHGRVSGGIAGAGKGYTRIELVDFLHHGQVTTKLGFHDAYGRLFLTSPIVQVRQVFA